MNLKTALIARGAYDLLFAIYLWAAPAAGARQALHTTGCFLTVDGLVALGVAVLMRGNPSTRWLAAPAIVDALARLSVGTLVLAHPNIEDRILSAVFLFTATIALCISMGLVGLGYAMAAKRLGRDYRSGTAWPLVTISISTLAFGVGLAVGLSSDETRRALVGATALAVGLTLLTFGFRLSAPGKS
ncbi:hypothetical protein ACSFBM_00165 [Variovorax sp. GB1R11]|uniref:hypothetical protein n=1 Tax=Variovorax sp. GB1R11 TaxID=3443741 RepID=UPI003F4544B0